MFIGHYGLGLASRKIKESPSLALLFIAAQLLDLLWPVFVLLGIETLQIETGNTKLTPLNFISYPYSHSLLISIFWGFLLGLIYFFITKNRKGSILLFGLVFSHWILDFITHRPDLQLSPSAILKSDSDCGIILLQRVSLSLDCLLPEHICISNMQSLEEKLLSGH